MGIEEIKNCYVLFLVHSATAPVLTPESHRITYQGYMNIAKAGHEEGKKITLSLTVLFSLSLFPLPFFICSHR